MAEEIELRPQLFWNYLDLTHHALRCGLPEKPYIDKLIIFIERAERFCRDEKLRYYRMSSRIVEAVTEEKFAGFYEMPLFSYYNVNSMGRHFLKKVPPQTPPQKLLNK